MPENSTLKCSADYLADTSEPIRPKTATLERILQFASTYQAIRTKDGHFMDIMLN